MLSEWLDAVMSSPSAPENILWASLVSSWVLCLTHVLILLRQTRLLATITIRPAGLRGIMTAFAFETARVVSLDLSVFSTAYAVYGTALVTLLTFRFNVLKLLWDAAGSVCAVSDLDSDGHEIARAFAYAALYASYHVAVEAPFDAYVYSNFRFDGKTLLQLVLKAQSKKFIMTMIETSLLGAALIPLNKVSGFYSFAYLFLFALAALYSCVFVFFNFVGPRFGMLAPLPAEDGLRAEVEALAESVGFSPNKVCMAKGSSLVAGFVGFLGCDRILLSDELLASHTVPEVLGVVGHELGHWKLNHWKQREAAVGAYFLVWCALFASFSRQQAMFAAFGFEQEGERPALIGLGIFKGLTSVCHALFYSALMYLSRRGELEADAFAAELGHGANLSSALRKDSGFEFPFFDRAYAAFYRSHPSLLERLQALAQAERRRN